MWTAGMGEWRMAGEVPAVCPPIRADIRRGSREHARERAGDWPAARRDPGMGPGLALRARVLRRSSDHPRAVGEHVVL